MIWPLAIRAILLQSPRLDSGSQARFWHAFGAARLTRKRPMTHPSNHEGSSSHEHHEHHPNHKTHKKRPIHHDWRLWVAVILALVGMAIYVMSDNEMLRPGGRGTPMPAAPAE